MARYDRVIPPGGKGKVTLSIDTSRVRGDFEKRATVWSNDLERRSLTLYLHGEVKPHIALEPGGFVGLYGVKGQIPREQIEIVNNHEKPLNIIHIENDMPARVRWDLEEIRPGFVYRLAVEDISKKIGVYTAHLIIRTDNPEKPTLVVVVSGEVTPEKESR